MYWELVEAAGLGFVYIIEDSNSKMPDWRLFMFSFFFLGVSVHIVLTIYTISVQVGKKYKMQIYFCHTS